MEYYRARDLEQTLQLLSDKGGQARLIAGGTDWLVAARQKDFVWPEYLVDLSCLDELRQISESGDDINIGSAVTHDELVHHPLIMRHAPLLAMACRQIGSQQIRNRGTIGGNICNASPCADAVTALVALDAELEICSRNAIRRLPIVEFIRKPYQTDRSQDEILTLIRIPKQPDNRGQAFLKLGRRRAVAISRINMAVLLELDTKRKIRFAALAPGSVFPGWRRLYKIEKSLIGQSADEELFAETGKDVAQEMIRISGRRWSTPYKEPVVAALVNRALLQASEMWQNHQPIGT